MTVSLNHPAKAGWSFVKPSVIPGFGLTLGYTVIYLSLSQIEWQNLRRKPLTNDRTRQQLCLLKSFAFADPLLIQPSDRQSP